MSNPFVKWECGCIGIPMGASLSDNSEALVFLPCDTGITEDDPLTCARRDMEAKTFAPLHDTDATLLEARIRRTISDGQSLRLIRQLLRDTTT